MKGFKKLALATAIAALPVSGFAMEAMDDAALSDVTGQDGLSLDITVPNATLDVIVHDTDGYTGLASEAGAIVISNLGLSTGGGTIAVDIDADANAGAPVLNVNVDLPATTIQTGDITVAGSAGVGNAVTNESNVILSSMTINMGAITGLNIQLGSEPQGNMINMPSTTITNGIDITNFSLADASSGETISAASIAINDSGLNDLTVALTADVVASGLAVTLGTLGGASGVDITMVDFGLGSTTVGDIEIIGLEMSGTTVTIGGK